MMVADIADEGLLPVGGRAAGIALHLGLECAVERVEIPAGTFAAKQFDGLIGHEAARRFAHQRAASMAGGSKAVNGGVRSAPIRPTSM